MSSNPISIVLTWLFSWLCLWL